ncbi:hypothetical protein CHS0354_026046 [Potamilus streckersoni]|uniref:Uncharacterized protein n=1 Tax=Potamilus streckersoni TaxID=2493646 RepID=A0AAE0SLK5_9BIVA|nr:hypothetical protein CHS0354_026046 [Potamilus streckersoni]
MGSSSETGCSFCGFLGFILLAMGVAKAAMGMYYVHDCELEPRIPTFLIVGGITSVVIGVLIFLTEGFHENKKSISTCSFVISIILGIFGIIWLIIGYTYVFPSGKKIDVPKCNTGDKNCVTCNSALLDFTIAIVVIEVVVLAAIGIYSFCK